MFISINKNFFYFEYLDKVNKEDFSSRRDLGLQLFELKNKILSRLKFKNI